MSNLDDFLARRAERVGITEIEAGRTQLLKERALSMWTELQQTTRQRAERVGVIDGAAFEWSSFPFLKLQPVAATFSTGTILNGVPQHCRVVFGRIPTAMYVDDVTPASEVWELRLNFAGDQMVWDVNSDEIIAAPSVQLAEQIIKRLVEYRDAYLAYYASGEWLT